MTDPNLEERIAVLSDALKSIAKNTCCDNCQEAARVARAALGAYVGLARDHTGDVAQTAPHSPAAPEATNDYLMGQHGGFAEGYEFGMNSREIGSRTPAECSPEPGHCTCGRQASDQCDVCKSITTKDAIGWRLDRAIDDNKKLRSEVERLRAQVEDDIPERFKHEVAAIANELGMDHQDLTTGKIAEFARKLRAQVEKLKGYAHHKSGCAYHYGHDCDCGVEELRK